eukprot:CAMPEP_0116126244 /NCGR_PEP_ID=MMETSP0329-20121206/6232_1 /TAXON_ID=697910 /ORGANISM="Pseudo-nitzschia arenysensis, Strain B593" /LENGTH=701 /DNA_ID=CAMNT_0003620321 /DNA_START=78 /DNA_END=2179 /DNA_ORIENTATION=-
MGVKEELEALRNQGVTKKNASKLKDANGLSTPEAEESSIKAEHKRNRIGNYGKEAGNNLKSYNDAKIALDREGLFSPKAAQSPRQETKFAEKVLPHTSNLNATTSSTVEAKTKPSSNTDLEDSSPPSSSPSQRDESSETRPQTPSLVTAQPSLSSSSPSSQPEDIGTPLMTPDNEPISEQDESKEALVPKLRKFLLDSLASKAVVSTFVISILVSFTIGLTVGIVPEILSDRYARLYHGYGASSGGKENNDLDRLLPCWEYDTSNMPEACVKGADDAQTGAAYAILVQNLLTFFFNAVLGSYSDTLGTLNALVPAALLAMEYIETLDPFWYYATNAATGFISFNSMVFAMLSDDCPEEERAGRFAVNFAGFYVGFAIAPMLPTYMSHTAASWWSFALAVILMIYSIVYLPETLPSLVSENNPLDPSEAIEESSPLTLSESNANSSCERESSNNGSASNDGAISTPSTLLQSTKNILLSPFREMTVLNRTGVLHLVTIASFLSAAVYSIDSSLLLFYIEEHLNVREGDIAVMFLVMSIFGVILQGFSLQPLVYTLGEKGLLVLTFLSGTVHNFLYGVASTKTEITAALGLSQLTKLSYPLLSSLASQQVGLDEQGRVQGALLALNALAGALGPVSMNWVYEKTKDGTHKPFGPGTMFLLSSGLYFLGTIVVSQIPSDESNSNNNTANNSRSANETTETTTRV